jgi:hypothetical protein
MMETSEPLHQEEGVSSWTMGPYSTHAGTSRNCTATS